MCIESLKLYDEIQRYAAKLEAEVVERKAAAASLGESEQRFRQIAAAINEVFFLAAPAPRHWRSRSPRA